MPEHNSPYTGTQIDTAVDKALNPTATPTQNGTSLFTSGGAYALAADIAALLASKAGGWKKMWENPSPGNSFAAQAVSIDLTDYDAVLVGFYGITDLVSGLQYYLFIKGAPAAYAMIPYVYIRVRSVTVANSGVTFGGGKRWTTYGTATLTDGDTYAIPGVIYAAKHFITT